MTGAEATVKEEQPSEKGGATNGAGDSNKASPPPRKRVVSLTAALFALF